MLRICHLSDWHGYLPKGPFPEADLYIVTGDMFSDYISQGDLNIHRTRTLQGKFIRRNPFREILPQATRDAPVLCVRGNHDWINLTGWFGGEVYEIGLDATVFTILGLRFGGFRGISKINGRWSDELELGVGQEKMEELPRNLHFLVTHAPPLGILDSVARAGFVERCGLQSLTNYVQRQLFEGGSLIGHFFGHIHEQYGFKAHPSSGPGQAHPVKSIGFSNASTGYLSYKLKSNKLTMSPQLERLFT